MARYSPNQGPQDAFNSRFIPNNGNPNGANNNGPEPFGPVTDEFDPRQSVNSPMPAFSRRNGDVPAAQGSTPYGGYFNATRGPVDAAGQHEGLGRYVPPTVGGDGRSTQRGPYSYNLPNAYGGGGINQGMPNFSTPQSSFFSPSSEFMTSFQDYIRNLTQQQAPSGPQRGHGLPPSPLDGALGGAAAQAGGPPQPVLNRSAMRDNSAQGNDPGYQQYLANLRANKPGTAMQQPIPYEQWLQGAGKVPDPGRRDFGPSVMPNFVGGA